MQSLLAALTFPLVVTVLCGVFASASSAVELHYDGSRGAAGRFQIQIYHRFSDALRDKAREHGVDLNFPHIPAKSPDYYKWAVRHDLARHGRGLAQASEALAFEDSNATLSAESDGLQYAVVEVGTPKVAHFVALDTGSDLFWLPCECSVCAPASSPAFNSPYLPDISFALNSYSPTRSTTSKKLACNNPLCSVDFSQCSRLGSPGTAQCSYEVDYAAENTSTIGTVYEDVIYLTEYQTPTSNITADVVVGCGQTQSGQLLTGDSAIGGLLGLGRAAFSLPSLISKAGLVRDSFSICFNGDGVGRLAFGDSGSPPISTTPFLTGSNGVEASYIVGLDAIQVGAELTSVSEPILIDTGTALTYLKNDTYTAVLESFDRQVNYTLSPLSDTFELCYSTTDANYSIPIVNFTFQRDVTVQIGFPVAEYYFLSNRSLAGFCLALLNSGDGLPVFGAHFMLFYNLVFNREEATLGFEFTDCYQEVTSTNALSPVHAPGVAPSPGAGSPTETPSPEPPTVPPSASSPGPRGSSGSPGSPAPSGSTAHELSFSCAFVVLLTLLGVLLPSHFQ